MIRKLVNFPNLDPKSGLAWASQIQDEQRRTELEDKLVKSLKEADPEAAEAWLEENRPAE